MAHIEDAFSDDEMPQVMLAIATHEAGHFLGIAHSDNRAAIMAAAYSDSALLSRDFNQDDIDAVCTIYPPDEAPDQCSEIGYTDAALTEEGCEEAWGAPAEGCSVVVVGPVRAGETWKLWLFAAVIVLLRGARKERAWNCGRSPQ